MIKAELKPAIKALIKGQQWPQVRELLADIPPPELADLLLDIEEKSDRVILFRALPRHLAADVFSYLDSTHQDALLRDLTDEETRHLLAGLRPDDRTHLLEELPGQATQRLLNLLSPEDRREARQLLGYPEESVGRLMTPDYVAVRPHWTIRRALEHIRGIGKDRETVDVIYVTDASWKLLDTLPLRRFILASPDDTVEQIRDHSFVSVSAFDDREHAVRVMQRYDLFALPVVDSDGVLLGIVTVDDVMDVAEEEATEDFHKVVAVAPLRMRYRDATVWELYNRRIGWLVGLVLINLASSGVIAAFEETLASAIALAFFIPLLIDSGGNVGAQSATLLVRALATGDVELALWKRAVLREVGVGAALGLTLGLVSAALGVFRGGFEIGMVVGLTMISVVVIANLVGVVLPLVLTRLRIDPAVASGPLITSLADVLGLLLYFSIATWVLRIF